MTLLATFKHISSKNADYGAAEAYLTFEHDEFTMKPTLDENGRLIPREDYRISSLNCGGEDFAVACMRANLRYEKNQKREDVKSHHYIISFDPRDGTDNGLTVDRAQELGEQFCKEHFPGHQALICTHPDGHNHSGNIHVHIVINSLRIYEVPLLPYMDRPADTREGCKHRCTNAAMEYFKSEVMEMCHREGLYQIDLLSGSKERITEREYWAAKKGQLALDKENAAREAAGQPTKPTKFETDKAKLRRTIRQALSQAGSFDEFSSLLLREGVTVKESRGRLSYLTPDRTKPITARKLGDDFDKAAVLALLTQNAHRAAEQTKAIPEYPHTQKGRLREEKAAKTTPADNTLQRMVDREAKRAEGKGVGYDRWAAKHNLKQMAATVTAYQQYGFSSPEELDEACSAAYTAMRESLTELKQVEKTLDGKKELQRQVLAYSKTRPVRDGLKQQKNAKAKAAYRQKHESDFIIADAAARYFRENGISKLPSYKALQAEIESLIKEKNSGYNDYRAKRNDSLHIEFAPALYQEAGSHILSECALLSSLQETAGGRQVNYMGVYDYHHDSGRSDRPGGVPVAEHVQETQTISPYKAYVEVIADFSADGRMKPLRLIWEDGRKYDVDRILRVDRCASLKAGGAGIRYVCRIQGQPVELYYEENGFWFVSRKVPKP